MDDDLDDRLGFAPDYDAPIPYMQRTRDYYRAIGYTTPYRWAHHVDAVPRAGQSCAGARGADYDCRHRPGKGDQGAGRRV